MEVDYLGYVHGTLAALRRMRPNDRGVIVQVGSAMAYWAIPLQATYCAAKFAIRGFIDALRTELLHDGSAVRVDDGAAPRAHHTAVHVGADHAAAPAAAGATRLLARGGSRRDAILHAAENPRRELWVGANVPLIIAGNHLLPRLADRYLARTNVDAQQGEEPIDPGRPDYLDRPLGDRRRARPVRARGKEPQRAARAEQAQASAAGLPDGRCHRRPAARRGPLTVGRADLDSGGPLE